MSYAIRKDGKGWRTVESKESCFPEEKWQKDQPGPIQQDEITDVSPLEKLRAFLSSNPDVAELI